jgi:hypothetical protein
MEKLTGEREKLKGEREKVNIANFQCVKSGYRQYEAKYQYKKL